MTNHFFHSLICLLLLVGNSMSAQCPGASSCDASATFCSVSQLNGFTCETPDVVNDYFPHPALCFGVGVPNNIAWWSFVGSGGPLQLSFSTDTSLCEPFSFAIQAGVFEGTCDGSQVWDCHAGCNQDQFTLAGTTVPGEIYYLWVDGCNAVICTYAITVSGNTGNASLTKPMPRLQVSGEFCPCGPYEVCFPGYPNGIDPHLRWTVDGDVVVANGGECESFMVPSEYTGGESIQVCLTATIGNPDDPNSICDQDQTCTTILVSGIETHNGDSISICFEDQPFVWHGDTIFSSCINPPCTVRAMTPEGCCVDSIRPIKLLQARGSGILDTFICDDAAFVRVNGDSIFGETCDSIILVSDSLDCDSSIRLTLRRPKFAVHLWTHDQDEQTLCLELDALPSCGIIDSTDYQLIWTLDGEIIDTLHKDSCINVIYSGEYGAEVFYPSGGCASGVISYVFVNTGIDKKVVNIIGQDFLCEGDSTYLLVRGNAYDYQWSNGISDTLLLIDTPGTYCVTGWRANIDTCTTCWEVEASDIFVTDTIIEADDGTRSGRIIIRIGGTHQPYNIRWSTGSQLPMIRDLMAGMYSVTLTNDKGCERKYNFEVPLQTSSSSVPNRGLRLFPNPTSSEVILESGISGEEYEILNVEGRVISKGNVSGVVDVQSLVPGVYLIRILQDANWRLATFVKY